MSNIIPIPRPPELPTGEVVFNRLKDLQRRIETELRAERKTEDWMPAWYVHLPSGEKVQVKRISREGPLIRFTIRDQSYVVVAPTALAITIEPAREDLEGFPVEFLDAEESMEEPPKEELE